MSSLCNNRRSAQLALAIVLCTAPAAAFAQATRTWVSGVGADANPCSRTAPCLTLAGAFSKTAPSGEIDVLDSVDLGALTITYAITIDGRFPANGKAAADAIIVAAGASDRVVLRNLTFSGDATLDATPGTNAVEFDTGGMLFVEHCTINNYENGIAFLPQSTASLAVADVDIGTMSNAALQIAPASGATANAMIRDARLANEAFGLSVSGNSLVSVFESVISGAATSVSASISDTSAADINLEEVKLDNDNIAIEALAPTGSATVRMSEVMALDAFASLTSTSGAGVVQSFGNNRIVGATGVCSVGGVSIGPATLPGATAGSAFSTDFVLNGGLGGSTFAVTSGALPDGLTLSGATLSGTPTSGGDSTFTITGTDSHGCSASGGFTLTVADAASGGSSTGGTSASGGGSSAGAASSSSSSGGNAVNPTAKTKSGCSCGSHDSPLSSALLAGIVFVLWRRRRPG